MSSVPKKYLKIADIAGLTAEQRATADAVNRTFVFRVSAYYSGLIDWSDPLDPLARIVLPNAGELQSDNQYLDPSNELGFTPAHGVQHKYQPTALLLVNDVCAAYCRFCFRKRFTSVSPDAVQPEFENETTFNVDAGVEYIANHPEINNVLLTGGDPLMLSVDRLRKILAALRDIPTVGLIRVGTKVPLFEPERVSSDLLEALEEHHKKSASPISVMLHVNHSRELTDDAQHAIQGLQKAGCVLRNQTPLLRGVNDSTEQLVLLHTRLASWGVIPYYLFHCRPTYGNDDFQMTFGRGIDLVESARASLSGLSKSFRYVGSDSTGKVELLGRRGMEVLATHHHAVNSWQRGRFWLLPQQWEWFPQDAEGWLARSL